MNSTTSNMSFTISGFNPLEPIPSHLTYLILSSFLLLYALFSELIRNRLHLSEPPLAALLGIIIGGLILDAIEHEPWRQRDNVVQEVTRVVTGIQVFTVGLDLPAAYIKRHWRSIALLLIPNMIFGWFCSATIIYLLFGLSFTTALTIAACLTPTDPVLSASVLGEAKFSSRVPRRLKHLLAAESGCNDGSAFPLLYAALYAITKNSAGEAVKSWIFELIVWQCSVAILIGAIIGLIANKALRFSEARGYVQESTLLAFYILLAMLTVGVGSTLGLDDFLVAFAAGVAFCWDGWFAARTHKMKLPSIIDLILNSAMFVYFGTIIPWEYYTENFNIGKMVACAVLILLLRRLPAMLALKPIMPDLHTWSEALFAGHFGPMGVGALFLAMEARAVLETGDSIVLPHAPKDSKYQETISTIWPVVCFIVFASIFVHGLSALVISIFSTLSRHPHERAPLLGGESARLTGMLNSDGGKSESEEDD